MPTRGPKIPLELEIKVLKTYKSLCNGKHPRLEIFLEKIQNEIGDYPGESWLRKRFTEWNKKYYPGGKKAPVSPEDKPWHLGTLRDYPVRPELIPLLMAYQSFEVSPQNRALIAAARKITGDNTPVNEKENIITIRDAKWISRLANLSPEFIPPNELCRVCKVYSMTESLLEELDMLEQWDTTKWDRLIFEHKWDEVICESLEWQVKSGVLKKVAEKRGNVKKDGDNG